MDFKSLSTRMTPHLVDSEVFVTHPFTPLDVGCSGGISNRWRVFAPSLVALGIDSVVHDCERLNAEESSPTVRYPPGWVGLPGYHLFVHKRGKKDPWGRNPWNRLSGPLATGILKSCKSKKERLHILDLWQDEDLIDSSSPIGEDDLVREENLASLDFIKIDIDGYDLDVILSAEKSTQDSPILGFSLEVNFYGSPAETDHTFHNTDKLIREWGFELFDLTIKRYSAAALPAPFEWDGPAETIFGRPYQGDTLYLRDPLAVSTQDCSPSPPLTPQKLLKLACLFETFGFPDHAAELLKAHSQVLRELCDPHELLDILAVEFDPSVKNYSDYIDKFVSDPTAYYRSK